MFRKGKGSVVKERVFGGEMRKKDWGSSGA